MQATNPERQKEINEGFHRGERWAYDAAARQHFAHIVNFINHLLRDHDRASELAQEAFFLACRAHKKFDPKRKLMPWLFQIARNLAYKELNQRKKHDIVSLEQIMEESYVELKTREMNPRQELVRLETMERIHRAIDRLKPKQKDILILRIIQGLPSETVADLLNIPISTVNTRTHRALKQLRRLSGQEGLKESEVFL